MKVLKIGLAVATLLILDAPVVSAQMVVSPNVGERVDYPFFSDDGRRLQLRHRHVRHHQTRRHVARYHRRFVILLSTFPTPQEFGWSNCCQ
jgi:hypothetical protein